MDKVLLDSLAQSLLRADGLEKLGCACSYLAAFVRFQILRESAQLARRVFQREVWAWIGDRSVANHLFFDLPALT